MGSGRNRSCHWILGFGVCFWKTCALIPEGYSVVLLELVQNAQVCAVNCAIGFERIITTKISGKFGDLTILCRGLMSHAHPDNKKACSQIYTDLFICALYSTPSISLAHHAIAVSCVLCENSGHSRNPWRQPPFIKFIFSQPLPREGSAAPTICP